jgi:hypothetical protein
MQFSDRPHREPPRSGRGRFDIASGSEALARLARRIAEVRERRRWLNKEIAFTDCRIAEARFERGQLRGRGRRKRRYADALSVSLAQLARQRDGLVRQLDASELGLGFEISTAARSAWAALVESFNTLRHCNGIANLPAFEPERRGPRQGGGPPQRPALFPPPERCEGVKTDVAPLHLRNGSGEDLLFFPGFLLLRSGEGHLALVDIRELKLSVLDPPAAAQPVPASREAPGPGISTLPVGARMERVTARPARLLMTSDTGLREIFDIGDRKRCAAFVEAMAGYRANLPDGPFVIADPDPTERLPSLDIPERFELPMPPPPSRWPAMLAGLATAAALLWVADRVTTAGLLDRLWGETAAVLSQAPDRIATWLATEPPPATESQTAAVDDKSAALSAIGTVKRQAEEEPPPAAGAVATAQLTPAIAQPAPASPPATDGASLGTVVPQQPTAATAVPPEATIAPAAAASAEPAAVEPELATAEPVAVGPVPVEPAPADAAPAPSLESITAALIAAAQNPQPTGTSVTRIARSEIVALQKKLQELGFKPGKADGVVGRRTRAAVRAFQETRGLRPTGTVDRELLRAILETPVASPPFVPAAAPPSSVADPVRQLQPFPWPYANVPRPLTASERGR